ncbi:MAG: hypothetical protein AB9834_12945 [Lentimicrobium sp.]
MKQLFIIFFLATGLSALSQVAVNTDGTNPDPSAMLDVKSTSRGMLVPRMTSAQRTAIASPASGLLVFDNDTQSFWFYSAGSWLELTDQSSQQWIPSGSSISYTSGNVGVGDASPASTLTVGDGDKFQVSGTEGDVSFTDDNASIQFPATTAPNSPMIYLFGEGTMNADRMVFGHSPNFPTWGIEYHDVADIIYLRNSASRVAGFKLLGGVGLGTAAENPHSSALLDVASNSQGFLPPRMTTAQRNAITSPAAGLVVYNTTENALNVFNSATWSTLMPVSEFECGLSVTVNHLVSKGVAPVAKTVTYNTVKGVPGETEKCWITSNLGADRQATSVDDATEASAGWYWQFNRKQGYKHDGTIRTPNTPWIPNTGENSDWVAANDPCTLELGNGWRLPSYTEWYNVDASGSWTDLSSPWNSLLRIHAAGVVNFAGTQLLYRGWSGYYWSSANYSDYAAWYLYLTISSCGMNNSPVKDFGFTLRCLRELAN